MTFFLLTSAFFLAWAVLGFVALAWWHDRQARRGGSCHVSMRQVILGGPVLWFLEVLNVLHRPKS